MNKNQLQRPKQSEYAHRGVKMPHDHIQLAQSPSGEIGPRCHNCGIRLTFGNAMVLDKYYYCWEHYVEKTGADTATVVGDTVERFYQK